ncbi:MAG: helix-turn-helix domain-containing protein [Myxococcales bacterium]|nr:helix-turn-helix domain-containing protein [Myxococcales bacterium]
MRLQILLLDNVFDTGLAAFLDCMSIANLLGANLPGTQAGAALQVSRVGVNETVATGQGLSISVDALVDENEIPDALVIPALGCLTPESLSAALARTDVAAATRFIESFHREGVLVAAACTGTFVVAMSGVLDGLAATTTWWLEPMFRERYPDVRLDASLMVIEQPGVVTAGAALGHVDLALWLIRQVSPQLAEETARYLLFGDRTLQSSFAMADHYAHNDPMVAAFESWSRSHLRDFSIEEAAKAVGASKRTLQRRVQKVLGRTPIAYVQDIRVQWAVQRLRTSDCTVEEIAEEVGYADTVTLRNLLRKKTGRGIRDLRAGS